MRSASRLFLSLLLLWIALPGAVPAQFSAQFSSIGGNGKHISAELVAEDATVAPGKAFRVLVRLKLDEHWHTYGQQEIEGTKPTALIWSLPEGWKTEPLPWPATKECPAPGNSTVQGYEGTVYLPTRLIPPADLAPGGTVSLKVKVDAIVCNLENCIPARNLTAEISLKTGAEAVPDAAHADLFKDKAAQGGKKEAAVKVKPSAPVSVATMMATPKAEKLDAVLLSEASTVAPGKPFRVAVKMEIAPGWHSYGKTLPEDVTGKPTSLTWSLPEGWSVSDLPWPATHEVMSTENKMVPAYEGTVYLPALITPPANLAPGSNATLKVKVDAVVCEKVCIPVRKLEPTLTVKTGPAMVLDEAQAAVFKSLPSAGAGSGTAAAKPDSTPVSAPATAEQKPAEQSLAVYLLFAFLGGLILNIMPCVFPVLALKVTSVVSQAHDDKSKVLLHGICYTLGVLVCLWTLDGILLAANAGGGHQGWAYQFREPWFVFAIVLIMLIFGLNMAGLFEVGTSAVGVGSNLTAKSGLRGSFFSGLLATVVATPCTAPFLASALTFALALPPLGSLGVFTLIGLGLASPYLLLGLFPSLLKLLPRPGVWMESFKQAMSFPMLAAAAYFTWVLLGQISEDNGRDLLIGLVVIALSLWIYGRWSVLSKPTPVRVRAIVAAVAFFLLGFWWAHPQAEAKGSEAKSAEVTWQAWSPELVAQLRQQNKPVYIDFTARWCATCQVNHRVYSDATLAADFQKRGVTLLKADWTKPDERIEKALDELHESAVPVNLLYVPGREKPVVLPKTLTVSNVQAALAELDRK